MQEVIAVQNVKLRLDAWRDAERRRDGLALGSSEWQEAEDDVRRAAKVFHAEVAQVSARYAEEEHQARNPWSAQLDGRTSGAGDSVTVASLARWPQR
jgi:hypothetical protein